MDAQTRSSNLLLKKPGGLCDKFHHQSLFFLLCGGLLGFALLLLRVFLIFLSLLCNNFLKDLVIGELLDVLGLWKVLVLDIKRLGSILLVLGSTAPIDLQVSNRQPRFCGVEGALASNRLKHSIVTFSYEFGNQGPILRRTHELQGNIIHRTCPLESLL